MRAPSPSLRLSRHVRACLLDQEVILLDLQCGKYIGLPSIPGIECHVGDWPIPTTNAAPTGPSASIESLIDRLRLANLVSAPDQAVQAPPFHDAIAAPPQRALNAEDVAQARPTTRLISRFLKASLQASVSIRFRTMQSIVRAAHARRTLTPADGAPPDESIAALVATYEHLRPLLFTVRDKCLFDSLALHFFLTSSGIRPTWIIGVKTRPFGAHSWLQLGNVVLNDQVEHVVQFKPLLAV